MSERNDLQRPPASVPPSAPTAAPATAATPPGLTGRVTNALAQTVGALPAPGAAATAPAPGAAEDEARARIASLEREARAQGNTPQAAYLFHEMGLLWEEPLKNPRNAAVAFQHAYRLAPKFLANIRAARRLFADVGNWQMVLQLLDAELQGAEEPRQRAALLAEKGALLEERLGREADAAVAYRMCLELQPQDVALLLQLEAQFSLRQDAASLVQVYRLLAATLESAAVRAHYLTQAALVLEDRLRQREAAAGLLREAFALDRRDPILIAALKRAAEREGNAHELLQALHAEAELLGEDAAPAWLQIAKVHEKAGVADAALNALLSARAVAPREPLVLSALAAIHQAQGNFEELADVLLAWSAVVSDEGESVALNLRLAALYEEDLKRDRDAAARYEAVLARVPGHAAALAALGKLHHRTGNWEGLLAVFDAEVAASEDPRQKAARMFKAAEILEERLGRTEDAVQRYNACLQLQPGYLPAQKALTRLYERQGRFADLVAMHEQDLLQTSDRDETIATLNKMAALYEERLGDLDHAVECMKRILDLAGDHLPALRNLGRLYERANRWHELIETLETEAGLVGDTKQVVSLHHRSAEILDEHLKDRGGAITAYERVLALSPSYLPALKALGRLYAQDGRWEQLIRMYRAEAEISSSPEQAGALIHKIGELYEHRLKNEHDAVASYQEVLTLAPSYFPALRALARLYRTQGHWESLVEVLRAEAANRADPAERANALFEAAAIWEDQLARPELAVEGYQEVLRLAPGHPASLRALERLHATRDEVKEWVAILERETQVGLTAAARVAAYVKLARLYLDRLNEPARAAACCEAALGLDGGNLLALKTLERVRVGDRVRRAELRARIAERVDDVRLRTALKVAAASDTGAGPEKAAAADAMLDSLRRAHEEQPQDARLAFALERALRQAGDAAGLVALYGRRMAYVTETAERLELLMRVGDLAETRLGDLDRAEAAFENALDVVADYLPALQGLRRVRARAGDWAGAREALQQEAASARDPRGAQEALCAAARIAVEHLNDEEGAVALYRQVLEKDALHPVASAGLEELLARRGGAADLAALQERRAEARLGQRDMPAAADAFVRAARARLGLDERERADLLVDRALAAAPHNAEALELKGQLSLEAGAWSDAATALSARVALGGERLAIARMHLTLGALYQDRLQDAGRATAHLQTALGGLPEGDAGVAGALARLGTLHAEQRNWTGAVDTFRRLLALEGLPAAERARHTVSLARVLDEGLGDGPGASALYREALELAPGDAGLVDRLVALYERAGNLPELAQMLESQAVAARGEPARALTLRLRLGELYARGLQDVQRAVGAYRQALEVDPGHAPARAALADLYTRDAGSAALAIEEHRTLLKADPARVESLHALFRLWDAQKQHDRAFCAAGVLHFLRATTETEGAFYTEARGRLPTETTERLAPSDVENILLRGRARGPLLEVLRAIGDQVGKLYPPAFEALGIDRKADRLKPDHAIARAMRTVANVLGVEDFEAYQARRGLVNLETTEPLGVCVGQDVVRKFNVREQKFLLARAAMGLLNKSAVLQKLSRKESADLLGAAVRTVAPDYAGLGRRNDELSKSLRKAASRKALKALEAPATALARGAEADTDALLDALAQSGDRAGLLLAADVSTALNLVLRTDVSLSSVRFEGSDPVVAATRERPDLQALVNFALSDEFFRLRTRLGLAVGPAPQ